MTDTQPISVTGQAHLYLTSALPTRNGLLMKPVIDTDTLTTTTDAPGARRAATSSP